MLLKGSCSAGEEATHEKPAPAAGTGGLGDELLEGFSRDLQRFTCHNDFEVCSPNALVLMSYSELHAVTL